MDIISLIVFIVVGALAGWLAGKIINRHRFGITRNIIVGIVGAVLGGVLFGLLGITTGGLLGAVIMGTIGAVLLLLIINLFKKA